MDDQFDFGNLPTNVSAKDLADALRRVQYSGSAMQIGNNSALATGRLGYAFPLDQNSNITAGISGQTGINNQYIPTKATGFDIGYQDPNQSFTLGYNANPGQVDFGVPIGKNNWIAKYKRSF